MAPSTASSRCSKRRHACWEPDRRRLDAGVAATSRGQVASFIELVGTAIANAESRAALARLAEEQAALRRVATLVARGTAPDQVFAAVIEEAGRLLPVDVVSMGHHRTSGTLTFVARWGKAADRFPVGRQILLGGRNVGTIVFETGRPARVEDYSDSSPGSIGAASHEMGIRSSVGSPIIVHGRSRVRRPLQGIRADRAPRWHRGGWRHARHDQPGWRRHNAAHPHPAQAVNAESWRPRQLASRPGLILHPQELLADAAASSYAQAPAAQASGTTASCSCGPWGFEPAVRTPVASQRAVHQLRRPRAHASRCITVLSWC
jgi:GAF domain